jgi:hypothetical protein
MRAICKKAEKFRSPKKNKKVTLNISMSMKVAQYGKGPNIALVIPPAA